MSEHSDHHFALEPDAVERYVRGSMEPKERRACDEHLLACAECTEAVRTERAMAAGVRRLGREELKRRLGARLKEAPQSGVPWPRILAAAAVVVTVLGIGYLNGWFQMRQDQIPVVETKGGEADVKRLPESEDRDQSNVKTEASKEQPLLSMRTTETPPSSAEREIAGQEQSKDQMKTEFKRAEPLEEVAAKQVGIPGARMAESARTISTPVQAWTNGEVRYDDQGKREKAREVRNKGNFDTQVAAAPQAGTVDDSSKSTPSVRYVIEQKAIKDLPQAQQSLPAIADRRIPVLLEANDGTVRIVLYVDPPLDPSTLQAAKVAEVGRESLVVRLSGRSIAVEIPQLLREYRTRR